MSEEVKASAWTLEPKKAQVIATTAFSSANVILDTNAKAVDIQTFSKNDNRLYMELGLFPSLMFVGQAGFQNIEFRGAGSDVSFSGFDETKLALQYRLKQQEGLAASVMLGYVIDGGFDDPRLNLGGRNDEVEMRVLYGRSKPLLNETSAKWVWFYDVQFGARYDLKSDLLSRWQLDLTAGIKPNDKWMGLVQVFGLDIQDQVTQGFKTTGLQQLKAEVSVAYKIKSNRYIQGGVLKTLTGRNIVQEKGLFTGLWQSF